MAKRKTIKKIENRGINKKMKRKSFQKSLNKITSLFESKKPNIKKAPKIKLKKNNNKNNIDSESLSQSFREEKINEFKEKGLIKSDSVIEKSLNGNIICTKTEIYENGKINVTKIYLKDHKILKKITKEIFEGNKNKI